MKILWKASLLVLTSLVVLLVLIRFIDVAYLSHVCLPEDQTIKTQGLSSALPLTKVSLVPAWLCWDPHPHLLLAAASRPCRTASTLRTSILPKSPQEYCSAKPSSYCLCF